MRAASIRLAGLVRGSMVGVVWGVVVTARKLTFGMRAVGGLRTQALPVACLRITGGEVAETAGFIGSHGSAQPECVAGHQV